MSTERVTEGRDVEGRGLTLADADFIQTLAYNTARNLEMGERSSLEAIARDIRAALSRTNAALREVADLLEVVRSKVPSGVYPEVQVAIAGVEERLRALASEPGQQRCTSELRHEGGTSGTQCAGDAGHPGRHFNGVLEWTDDPIWAPPGVVPLEMRYHTYGITFDMEGRTQGDFEDFRRALDRLEVDFPGTLMAGCDSTRSWPTFIVRESATTEPEAEATDE